MAMDMIEHETPSTTPGTLSSRGAADIFTIGTGTAILNRSFLVKRMEIEFILEPPVDTSIDDGLGLQSGYLLLQKTSAGSDSDTPAEAFDALLENKAVHETVVWSRPFGFWNTLIDVSGNDLVELAQPVVFKTSKSFPKGYPLDKDEIYIWRLFNSGATSWLTGVVSQLRVRYWGVFL